jgi:hypothetical protein
MDVLAFASFAVLVVAWIVAPTRTVVSTNRTAVATSEPATIAGKAA